MTDKQLIIIAIFTTLSIILIYKFWKGKKALEKKKKNGDGIVAKAKEKLEKNRNRILIGGFSFIALFASFAILLPKAWAVYWGHQDFFWISQVYLATMIALKWLDIGGIKLFIRIAFTIIIVWYISDEFKPPPPPPNGAGAGSSYGQTYTQRQQEERRNGVKTKYVVAPVAAWSDPVKAKWGHDWRWRQDEVHGLKNIQSLIKVRINGKEVVEEERMPNGNKTGSYSNTVAHFVEFQSKEAWPVHMVVNFIEKR